MLYHMLEESVTKFDVRFIAFLTFASSIYAIGPFVRTIFMKKGTSNCKAVKAMLTSVEKIPRKIYSFPNIDQHGLQEMASVNILLEWNIVYRKV